MHKIQCILIIVSLDIDHKTDNNKHLAHTTCFCFSTAFRLRWPVCDQRTTRFLCCDTGYRGVLVPPEKTFVVAEKQVMAAEKQVMAAEKQVRAAEKQLRAAEKHA